MFFFFFFSSSLAPVCIQPAVIGGYDEMSALQMDYVSISVRTQRQSGEGWGWGCTLLDADGFKLLPLFSIRHEAVTSLICAAALMFWVNELSAHRSASSSRLRCCYANHGAAQASSTFCRSPLGVWLPTVSHSPGRPCMWSRLFFAALFEDAEADCPGCYSNTCPDLLTSDNMQIRWSTWNMEPDQ